MIDSHAHLDMDRFDEDRDEVIARAMAGGLTAIISIGIDEASSRAALELSRRYEGVFATAGIHPSDTAAAGDDLTWLSELAGDERVVAIGEIGLDFYHDHSPRERQLDFFRRQLDLATALNMPVVIHCREAHAALFPILEDWVQRCNWTDEPGVMHCFSGDAALAERYIELGFLVSLAGPVTYPKAAEAVAVACSVPAEKLLVETDCPYLPPQPYRGRRNEPAYVSLIVEKIAGLRNVPVNEIARITDRNAMRLFRLPEKQRRKDG
jgi:TatD DNase family protein